MMTFLYVVVNFTLMV